MTRAPMGKTTPSELAVGIDLGTTYSVLACLDASGRPKSIPNAFGELLTPSAILVNDDEIIVGKEAVKSAPFAPQNYADCFKRDMGRPEYRRTVRNLKVPPEVLSALVLARLKQDAEQKLGPLRRAVITVPAYFDEPRRKATQDAGRLAGWDVLDIVNEPTAAALAYGYDHGHFGLSASTANVPLERVLVYDLGGGTFDVTLLEIDGSTFRTLATDGDLQLGGKDFDARLVDHVSDKFQEMHNLDPRCDPADAAQLWIDAQDARHALTDQQKTTLFAVHAGLRLRLEVSRAEFFDLTQDLLERTRDTASLVLKQAGLKWNQIGRVLAVGGASRMPMVGAMLRDLTGKEPDRSLSPDESVAHGAALYAGMLLGQTGAGKRTCELINVNSHSLGVVGIHEKSGQRVNAVLIPRNTPIPTEAVRTCKTADAGQRSVAVHVVEGESEQPEYCVPLGKCVVRDLPVDLPKGTLVEVKYRYASSGRVSVTARIRTTGQSAEVEIERATRGTQESLETWIDRLQGRVRMQDVDTSGMGQAKGSTRPFSGAEASDVDPSDRGSVIRRLDAIYVEIGELCRSGKVSNVLASSLEAVELESRRLDMAKTQLAKAEQQLQNAVGQVESVQRTATLAQARQEFKRVESAAAFALLVLGRDCVDACYCPPGAEAQVAEARKWRSHLEPGG